MAHQIDKAAFVTANVPAWHQLGTVLDGAFTAEQALEMRRLGGWKVRKSPLFVAETGQPAEGAYATIRDNPFEPGQVDVRGVVSYDVAPLPTVAATVEASRTYVCDVWSEIDGETWRASVELSEAVYSGK